MLEPADNTALEDIESFAYGVQEAVSDLSAALDRLRTELCIAVGAPGYAWTRAIPADVAAAIDEVGRCADAAALEAFTIIATVRAEVANHA